MSAPNVAFCRPLFKGMSGPDVVAHKRALSRWDASVYPWGNFTDYFGDYFEDAVREFQVRNASEISPATGRIGQTTHEVLERKHRRDSDEWAFDTMAIELARDFCADFGKTPEQKIREAICSAGFFWYSHKWEIAYSQYRPMFMCKPIVVPPRWDCSAFVTNCYFAGGANDPNGRGYDGLGYTGTLMDHGVRVGSVVDLDPGDLIFYGSSVAKPGFNAGDPTHVALYVGFIEGEHRVITNGSYPMKYIAYNYRHDIHHFRHYTVV